MFRVLTSKYLLHNRLSQTIRITRTPKSFLLLSRTPSLTNENYEPGNQRLRAT